MKKLFLLIFVIIVSFGLFAQNQSNNQKLNLACNDKVCFKYSLTNQPKNQDFQSYLSKTKDYFNIYLSTFDYQTIRQRFGRLNSPEIFAKEETNLINNDLSTGLNNSEFDGFNFQVYKFLTQNKERLQ